MYCIGKARVEISGVKKTTKLAFSIVTKNGWSTDRRSIFCHFYLHFSPCTLDKSPLKSRPVASFYLHPFLQAKQKRPKRERHKKPLPQHPSIESWHFSIKTALDFHPFFPFSPSLKKIPPTLLFSENGGWKRRLTQAKIRRKKERKGGG